LKDLQAFRIISWVENILIRFEQSLESISR